VEALCRGVERPIVLPLSNPTPLAEVTPENLLRWSGGRALLATGSPFRPVATAAGAFDQSVVRALCRGVERPIVLPLSNPTRLAEATPADLLRWSDGRALVATGSPFEPVIIHGRERVIGQCNNCFVFPGLGFAAMAVGASQVSEGMIDAALEALASRIPAAGDPDEPLMPPLADVRQVSQAVAEAVAKAAVAEGLARRAGSEAEALVRLQECRWQPVYRPVLPA